MTEEIKMEIHFVLQSQTIIYTHGKVEVCVRVRVSLFFTYSLWLALEPDIVRTWQALIVVVVLIEPFKDVSLRHSTTIVAA